AEQDGGARIAAPCGLELLQVGDEAEAVGIVAEDAAVVAHDERVDGADALRRRSQHVDEADGALLVRQGDVAAAEAERRQRADALLQPVRVWRERGVHARGSPPPAFWGVARTGCRRRRS